MSIEHESVLLNECIEHLNINPDGIYVDGTLGGCGHSKKIHESLSQKGLLVGIDRDENVIANANQVFIDQSNTLFIHSNFSNIKNSLNLNGISKVDGILLDLGVSSYQIDTVSRGFSYMEDSFLDMRMDPSEELTASEILNEYTTLEMVKIFRAYGEEPMASKISNRIDQYRKKEKIQKSSQLVEIIQGALGKGERGMKAVKRIFQALRIEVNQELSSIEKLLDDLPDLLAPNGRIVIITFHSLEDRIVKHYFKRQVNPCTCPPQFPKCVCNLKPTLKLINRKPILPTKEEMQSNSRSRSAKLRVAQRI